VLRAALILAALGLLGGGVYLYFRDPEPAPPVSVERQGFRVPPVDGDAEVWAVGDGADGSRDSRAVARLLRDADAVLYLGDVYQRGTRRDFETKVRGVYEPVLKRMLPTPGNHDWPRHDEGYDPFWASVAGTPTPPWYSLRIGAWEVLSLNSEAVVPEQTRWLRAQLTETGTCRLAFLHRPRFNAGRHDDADVVDPLWDELKGHVALVLAGHDHNLQRHAAHDGIVQIVSGAGGREHYDLDPGYPGLEFGDDERFGAVRLTLRRDEAEIEFVAAGGRVLDRSTVGCVPAG
jgi:calcineurin-like phosphoesterase family protein